MQKSGSSGNPHPGLETTGRAHGRGGARQGGQAIVISKLGATTLAFLHTHAQLLAILRKAGHAVRYHKITLGTTGTTRNETLNTLQQLGMVLLHALNTTNKLHQHAMYIDEITKQCNGNSHTMLAAGDWNATLHPSDRSEGNHNPTGQKHAHNCTDLQLRTTAGPTRQHTYH